jgi:hypothetical protein
MSLSQVAQDLYRTFQIAAALVALCLVKAKKTDNFTPMNFSMNSKITKMVPENTMKKSVTNA